MTKPTFSIIIPSLNEEKYLPHLLTDLSKQTLQDFEVIVVDGHSEDKTIKQANKLASKLPSLQIISSDKRHVCVQRNLGAKSAKADTLVFMDADNRLPDTFLQDLKFKWESQPTDLATTWTQPEKPTPYYKTIALAINLYYDLLSHNFVRPGFLESLIVINKSVFQAIGGFNTEVNFGEGFDLIESIIAHKYQYNIYKEPQYVYSLRRLRKYGTLKALYAIAFTQIQDILDIKKNDKISKIYPMLGGGLYEQDKANKFIASIRSKLTTLRTKNKIYASITKLYQDLLSS